MAIRLEKEKNIASNIRDAFRQYRIEQRWFATFNNFDFKHETAFALFPINSLLADIETIFPDIALQIHSLPPSTEIDKHLKTANFDFTEETVIKDIIEFARSYKFAKFPINIQLELYTLIWESIKTWRARMAGVEISENTARFFTEDNKQLEKGLSALESLFTKIH